MAKVALVLTMLALTSWLASADTRQDFEGGQGDWYADNGVWEVGTPAAGPPACHAGTRCAGTVLGGNYPKSNSRLISPAIRLSHGTPLDPVLLRFRQWFSWASLFGSDSGIVQVSVYDSSQAAWSAWTDVGAPFQGTSGVWTLHVADLTSYSGQLVRIAFLHRGTGAQSASGVPPSSHGWFVDDIEIAGTAVPPARYSTLQDFETGQGVWFADNGVWEVGLPTAGPPSCHGGMQCAGTVLNGNYPKTNSRLISPPFQVPQGTVERPVLFRFWQWFSWAALFGADSGVVQVSVYDPTLATWGAWADAAPFMQSASGVWSLNIVDLTRYSGELVRVGFYHRGTGAQSASSVPPSSHGWFVDDIALGVSVADIDNDGLPDDWETQFGLDPSSAAGDDGAAGDPDGDDRTNLQEYQDGTHPRGFVTRYFAEGATSSFFDTTLALVNLSTTSAASVLLRFQRADGSVVPHHLSIGPRTRRTVDVKAVPGMAVAEFSTVVESDEPIVADRTMTWDNTGYGSHAETSIASPATTWYLAEGATHSGFNLFYLLQNPNGVAANVQVTYLRPAPLAPLVRTYPVSPHARANIWVDLEPGLENTDVSAVFTSDVPIIVERAMYLDQSGRPFGAGHESAGIPAPATEWFLAEGATGSFFDLFVLIANPGDEDAAVTTTFLLPVGPPVVKHYTVAAKSRFNVWVDLEDALLADTAVSTVVTSTNAVPIIVERAMWWPGPAWAGAHNSAGLTSTGRTWALADGEVGGPRGLDTYVLIANRGGDDTARVTLLYEDGTSESKDVALPASSRTNVAVRDEFPNATGRRFGAIVEALGASPEIAVERAMYGNASGIVWATGTNAVATRVQ